MKAVHQAHGGLGISDPEVIDGDVGREGDSEQEESQHGKAREKLHGVGVEGREECTKD